MARVKTTPRQTGGPAKAPRRPIPAKKQKRPSVSTIDKSLFGTKDQLPDMGPAPLPQVPYPNDPDKWKLVYPSEYLIQFKFSLDLH